MTAIDIAATMVAQAMAQAGDRLAIVGIAGAQGSGKSTLATAIKNRMDAEHVPTALLSIDDLYLTKAERIALARDVHPLLRTRGVPGTHDVSLGLELIAALEQGEAVALPRFDKGADDRLPRAQWDRAPAGAGLLLLEGWCVGARPQHADALNAPINALEREEDAGARWRRYVNAALAGPYQRLFDRIDRFIFLAAPDFSVVGRWRGEQEQTLRAVGRGMDDAALTRFIQHYERITRHMLDDMPHRADMLIQLDTQRRVVAARQRSITSPVPPRDPGRPAR
ncbi:kinase [Sphingobium lactosutens DS20]|uniref:Kinase n=2 Tax=Sphingobium TaxID=165695 RepID=T0HBI3_9SPHN|nr:kinase [Sphingobium lactosutens DS20]